MTAGQHGAFVWPANMDAALWRYMDFAKFVWMLNTASLYFCRADLLGDPFEGSYSRANERLRPEAYKDVEGGEELSRQLAQLARKMPQWTFVNCWHMNDHESAAMWKLYSKSNDAVAIKTSFRKLVDELDAQTYAGNVQYIDFEREWMPEGNPFYPFVHKRLSFAHEREVRAVIQQFPVTADRIDWGKEPERDGIVLGVNLSRLIDSIHIAPTSPRWFADLVETVCSRFDLRAPVRQSSLDGQPFY